jgi:solute carrier family 25 carnitine/acylcarnitine transporter 20/29
MFRDAMTPVDGDVSQLSVKAQFVAGGGAGFLYWFLTYPTDVIKSAMMSDHSDRTQRRWVQEEGRARH